MIKVAETQRRGLAGMGGRAVETTNAWDPAEQSVAQRTAESKVQDVYRDHRLAPDGLSYGNKVERRRIHRHVYGDALRENGGHIDLDSIEAEVAELIEKDPEQAERFFGNRVVAGSGKWMDPSAWANCADASKVVADREVITIGFDGAQYEDSTALIGCRCSDGHLFDLGIFPVEGPARSTPRRCRLRWSRRSTGITSRWCSPTRGATGVRRSRAGRCAGRAGSASSTRGTSRRCAGRWNGSSGMSAAGC
jgi:hypothetical protein